jgi:clan AA aspartic protease (TIGR02281 family)
MVLRRLAGGAVVLLVAWAACVRAQEKAPADAVLRDKGLTRVGGTYLLEPDAKLPELMRRLRQAKKRVDDDAAKRAEIDKDIQKAREAEVGWDREKRDVDDKLSKTKDPTKHNQLASQHNVLLSKMREAERYIDERQNELAKMRDPWDDWVQVVLDVSDKMEAASKRYEELSADDGVKAALASLRAAAGLRARLGPSAQFTQELPFVRKQRELVDAGSIKLIVAGGVAQVNVMLNGTVSVPMVLDSGASSVCVSWEVAQQAGIKPGPKDPVVKTVIANGKMIDSTLVTLRSVRVGPFTAENVECLVAPPTMKEAPNLLGGAYLRNFVYRMDLTRGELHMSPLGGKMEVAVAATRPSPATAPATEPATVAGGAGGDPDVLVEKGWTILFRSSDPAHWNMAVHDADSYAVPLEKAPAGMAYLRMRNAAGDYVIIQLTRDELQKHVGHEKYGWEGRSYPMYKARHLGIFVKAVSRNAKGAVVVSHVNKNVSSTGYGFGNRMRMDDRQGYAWDGKPAGHSVFEIAVTAGPLTEEEKKKVLGD